jgi:arylsulfatase A
MNLQTRTLKNFTIAFSAMAVSVSCQDRQKAEEEETKKPAGEKQPNVVMVLADDLGWKRLGCYGSDYYETPNLDALASDGMRFTQAYTAASISSPTRASLMTGQHPARLNITDFIPGSEFPDRPLQRPDWQKFLPLEKHTIGEAFQENGYSTGYFGKWHLSKEKMPPESHSHNPDKQGFDESFVTYKPVPSMAQPWQKSPEDDPHNVDTIATRAVEFIESHRDQPFFLVASPNSVHTPLIESQELIDKYEDKWGSQKGENTPVLAAMIETLDKSVGRIRGALKEAGIEENTIFIFYSENGGLERSAVQTPFRRGKGWLYEGGIRVPLIVRWDGQIEEGSRSDALVTSNDMYPTLLNMTGIPVEKEILDGKNIFPVLKGEKESVRNSLYWHYPHYHGGSGMKPGGAMRKGDYKLIVWYEELLMDTSDPYELYNVSQDKGETVDLTDELPGKAEEMKKEFDEWKKTVDAQMPKVR